MNENLTIVNESKSKPPRLPFLAMKEKVLGKKYELDLVFVSPKESKRLNKIYRKKNNPTDILSFPLSKNEGEIIIDIKTSNTVASDFNRTPSNFIAFLFIHGLFHLKGMSHGSRMEAAERLVRTYFKV